MPQPHLENYWILHCTHHKYKPTESENSTLASFRRYFGKTKRKSYAFTDSFIDWQPTFWKLCLCYWSTSGAGNLITGCWCVTGSVHFPSKGVFQKWIKELTQQVCAPISIHCAVLAPYPDLFLLSILSICSSWSCQNNFKMWYFFQTWWNFSIIVLALPDWQWGPQLRGGWVWHL